MKFLMGIFRVRMKSIIAIGILLCVNILLALYVQFWLAPRNEALQVRRNEQQKLLASGGGDISAVYQQGTRDLEAFFSMVPPRKSFARVVGEILELAQNSGLTVSGVTYKPDPVVSGGLIDYVLSFSVAGKYAGVKSYLADLQRFREMVVIDHFSLGGVKTTEEAVDLKLDLTVYLKTVAP
jgi:type IV pilus assembly protein PilO